MILGWIQLIVGVMLWVLAIAAGIAWIGFCFGTIIIGILLLFFAPRILIFPTAFISVFANGFLLVGLVNIKKGVRDKDIIDSEAEWVKTDDDDDYNNGHNNNGHNNNGHNNNGHNNNAHNNNGNRNNNSDHNNKEPIAGLLENKKDKE